MQFSEQVVLITGASRGLGLAFARCIAQAGATVVLNSRGNDKAGQSAAAQIVEQGSKAIHISGPAEAAADLVESAVNQCGRLDAIVHNAGFVQDKTLRKMTNAQWDAVLTVHLKAAFELSQAAWPHFEDQGGGRLVFISSASGLYGNFGQANYAAAKAGLHGLSQSIAIEGEAANIKCNCVAPFGATQMNSQNFPQALKMAIKADYIAPLVGYLAHPECAESGGLFEASAGVFRKVRWESSQGLELDPAKEFSISDIAQGWDRLCDFSQSEHPTSMRDSLRGMYERRL